MSTNFLREKNLSIQNILHENKLQVIGFSNRGSTTRLKKKKKIHPSERNKQS